MTRSITLLVAVLAALFIAAVVVVIVQADGDRMRIVRNQEAIAGLSQLEFALRELGTTVRDAAHADEMDVLPVWPEVSAEYLRASAALNDSADERLEIFRTRLIELNGQISSVYDSLRLTSDDPAVLQAAGASFGALLHGTEDEIEAMLRSYRQDQHAITGRMSSRLNVLFLIAVASCAMVLAGSLLIHMYRRTSQRFQECRSTRRHVELRLAEVSESVSGVAACCVPRGDLSGQEPLSRERIDLLAAGVETAARQSVRELEASRRRFAAMFEQAPVNLKEMDMTDLLDEIDRLRAGGVSDFREYFQQRPDEVRRLAALGRTVQVNQHTLKFFGAASNQELLDRYSETREAAHEITIREQVVALSEGRVISDFEVPVRTLAGERRTLWVHVSSLEPENPRPTHLLFTSVDVTRRAWAESMLELQKLALEQIASGCELQTVLNRICEMVEQMVPDGVCSIMTLDSSKNALFVAAGPSLSPELCSELDGLVPGDRAGSCGASAWWGEPVYVSDTRTDPRWSEFRDLAERFRIGACWSYPVKSEDGRVLATFAISNRTSLSPDPQHVELLEVASHLTGIALRRDQSQRILRESQQRLKSLAEHIPGVVYSYDLVPGRGRQLVHLGPGFEELLGPRNAGAIRERFDTLFDLIHPDDRERVAREAAIGSKHESTVDLEARLRTDDGSYVWIRSISRPIRGEGGRVHWHVVVVNIEQQKQHEQALRESELRFRTLYDENPSMFFTVAEDGRICSVNEFGARQLGFEVSELIGSNVEAVFHSEDQPTVRRLLADCARGRTRNHNWELRKVRKDGSIIWVREAARSIRDVDGRTMILIVCEDITDRKHIEEELRRKAELERLLFRELDHRVRNNLSSLVTLIDLTRRSSSTTTEFAATIRARVEVMAAVHGLLSRSHWAALPLRLLIDAIIPARLRSQFAISGRDALIPPRQVTALGMVIHELLTNSVKYGALSAPGGRVDLSWSGVATVESATQLTLRWEESGGPAILDDPARGAGSELIEGLVRTELRGRVKFSYPIQGASHRIDMLVDRSGGELTEFKRSEEALLAGDLRDHAVPRA